MDCNSYSYAPDMLKESSAPKREPVNSVTIERREHNGYIYYVIRNPGDEWFTKVFSLDAALKTVHEYFTEGI